MARASPPPAGGGPPGLFSPPAGGSGNPPPPPLPLAFLPVVVALALPVRAQEPPVPQGGCTGTFAGRWNTDFGWVEFQLQGSQARGYYEWGGGAGAVQGG